MRSSTTRDRIARLWMWACACIFTLLTPQLALPAALIATVKSLEAEPYRLAFDGFQEALASGGHQVRIKEYLLKEEKEAKERLLAEIAEQRPSLILTLGSAATTLIQGQVKELPVVFCMVLNPVASGFVRSMQSSGNNLTGASLDIPFRLQFETLQAVVPSVRRVGVLYNPKETGGVVGPAAEVAAGMGLELVAVPVASAKHIPDTVAQLRRKVDALWSVADSTVFASDRSVEFLLRRTLEYKIPFMGLSPPFVKAGALLALSVDYKDVGGQCGEQAAQVLAGRPPSSLPITTPRKVTLYLNLNVARTIGVEIPSPTLETAVVLR